MSSSATPAAKTAPPKWAWAVPIVVTIALALSSVIYWASNTNATLGVKMDTLNSTLNRVRKSIDDNTKATQQNHSTIRVVESQMKTFDADLRDIKKRLHELETK